MEMRYKVVGIKKRNKSKKVLFFLLMLFIIPFLGFISYFVINRSNPFPLIKSIFIDYTPNIKYETFRVYVDDSVPEDIVNAIKEGVEDIEFQGIRRFEFVEERKAKYIISVSDSVENSFITKQLIPVGHAYWIKGKITKNELKNSTVYLEEDEYRFAKKYISEMFNTDVKMVNSLEEELKKSENNIGFVFPSNLSNGLKVLLLDGKYAFEDGSSLQISYSLKGRDTSLINHILSVNVKGLKNDVIDTTKVVKINMTGVTAISRGLTVKTNASGNWGYAAQSIGKFLADADLTHTSNEVSFVNGCNVVSGMRFCSRPEYIQALKDSGIDIVELTGNHNNDYGADNNAKSIEIYKELGWDYFGGGLNKEDASKILYKEVKGSTVAFLGYNYYDSMFNNSGALAGDSRAGANSYSTDKVERDIKEAKENADVVIVSFQFQECYSYPPSDVIYPICYKPLSTPDQKGVFRKAIDLGADVVVGTQAHQPQTYEVYKDKVIFYGLGNLYFDQHRWIGTRQGLVLSLYILEGNLVQARLTPTIYDTSLITKVANEKDGDLLLNLLKSARDF